MSSSVEDASLHSETSTAGSKGSLAKKRSFSHWVKKRLSSSSSTRHAKKDFLLVLEQQQPQFNSSSIHGDTEERNDCHTQEEQEATLDDAAIAIAVEEATRLKDRGLQEYESSQFDAAMATWQEALRRLESQSASTSTKLVCLSNHLVCRLIALRLELYTGCSSSQSSSSEENTADLDQALAQMSKLQLPLLGEDAIVADCAESLVEASASFLTSETSSLLLDFLARQPCGLLALHVAHKLPATTCVNDPLLLARLHLEVALQYQDVFDDNSDTGRTALSKKARSQQLSHLSECHQLLLCQRPENNNDFSNGNNCQALWKDLARAYGMMGEDELALGCSHSCVEFFVKESSSGSSSSINCRQTMLALCHYEQAMDVFAPVGHYGLALKEAELALDALQPLEQPRQHLNQELCSNKEQKDEDDSIETESLLMKLYQFKADVLCRMGRIADSIQSYEVLLEAYQESPVHGPVDAANVLYVLGKLSVRAKRFQQALEYFDQELQMTKSVVGPNHLACSKILHELARVADLGMMDYPRAVKYYQEALQVESYVFQQCKQLELWQKQHKQASSPADTTLLQDAKIQMGETKQCIGKLHFKMGDFSKAVGVAVGNK